MMQHQNYTFKKDGLKIGPVYPPFGLPAGQIEPPLQSTTYDFGNDAVFVGIKFPTQQQLDRLVEAARKN